MTSLPLERMSGDPSGKILFHYHPREVKHYYCLHYLFKETRPGNFKVCNPSEWKPE